MSSPFGDWLARLGAHHDLVTWASGFEGDTQEFWRATPRGDWLLGVAARLGARRPGLVRAALAAAKTASAQAGDDALVAEAVSAASGWALRGGPHADLDDLAARLEEAASEPATAAALGALAAALRTAGDPEQAPFAAGRAVEAAAFGGGDDPMAAVADAQRATADAVRQHLPASAVPFPFKR